MHREFLQTINHTLTSINYPDQDDECYATWGTSQSDSEHHNEGMQPDKLFHDVYFFYILAEGGMSTGLIQLSSLLEKI